MQLIAAQAEKDGLAERSGRRHPYRAAAHAGLGGRRRAEIPEEQRADAMRICMPSTTPPPDKTEYHARTSWWPARRRPRQLIKKIKGGAKFEDVAKAESTDNSKANGGDLGWFTLARMVKPFGDAVKPLKKGEITQEPVQTQFGWHVIQLEDTRDDAAAVRPGQAAAHQRHHPEEASGLCRRPEEEREDREEALTSWRSRTLQLRRPGPFQRTRAESAYYLQQLRETRPRRARRCRAARAFLSFEPGSAPATT